MLYPFKFVLASQFLTFCAEHIAFAPPLSHIHHHTHIFVVSISVHSSISVSNIPLNHLLSHPQHKLFSCCVSVGSVAE
ncbi:MAG: hypothetical protein LBU14_01480 [Candidatus Peribacteria bacterium]|jgi:hypothetical protein|nr:hypothetical protein [Candidatus Peribacteria bacterium]